MAYSAPYISGATSGTLTTGTPSLNIPAGYADGDIAIAFIWLTNTSTGIYAVTTPSGWLDFSVRTTGLIGSAQSTYAQGFFFYKRISGTQSSTSFTCTGSGRFATITLFKGVSSDTDPSNAIAVGNSGTAGTSLSTSAITSTVDESRIAYFMGTEAPVTSPPTPITVSTLANTTLTTLDTAVSGANTIQYNTGFSSNAGTGIAICSGTLATAGSTGSLTATTTNGIKAWVTIALTGIDSGGAVSNNGYKALLGVGK